VKRSWQIVDWQSQVVQGIAALAGAGIGRAILDKRDLPFSFAPRQQRPRADTNIHGT
jgi:hypothetical protein